MSRRGFYTEKELRRKRIWLRIKILLSVLLVLLGFLGLIKIINSEYFRISDFSVSKIVYGDPAKIDSVIKTYLEGKSLLLNNNSTWKFSSKTLIGLITEAELSVKKVDIEFSTENGKKAIKANIEERTPMAIWCADGHENCYYVDQNGFVFGKSADFDGEAFLAFRGGDYGISKTIESKYRIPEIIKLKSELKKIRVIVEAVEFDGDIENISVYHEKNPTDKFLIKIDSKTDLDKLSNRLALVIKEYWIGTVLAPKDVTYIDMRFENNVVTKIEKKK